MDVIVARGKIRSYRRKAKAFVLGAPLRCALACGARKRDLFFLFFPRISSWATFGHASGVLRQHAYLVDPPRRTCSWLQGRSTPKPTSFDHRGHEGTQRKAKEKTKTPPGLPQGVQRRCHTCMVGSRWVNGWICCSRENTGLPGKGKGIRFGASPASGMRMGPSAQGKRDLPFSFFPGFHPGLHWVTPPAFLHRRHTFSLLGLQQVTGQGRSRCGFFSRCAARWEASR